jgi:hypothetical protein
MKNLLKQVITIVLSILFFSNTNAQNSTKFSADLSVGIPVTFFTITPDFTGIYQAGLRYSINKNWSISARYASKTFQTKTGNALGLLSPIGGSASDVLSYKNSFYDLGANLQFNLGNLLGISNSDFLPYATLGGCFQFWDLNTSYINGTSYKVSNSSFSTYGSRPMRIIQMGLGVRYYLSPSFDLNVSSEYNHIQSYFMDGAYDDKKLDTYLNTSFGVSYKIGSKSSKNLAEWESKNKVGEKNNDKKSPGKDYAHWSTDLNVGLPYLSSPIGFTPTAMCGIGVRYSLNKFLSVQAAYNYGILAGNHNTNGTFNGNLNDPINLKNFNTSMSQVTLRGFFNLRRIFSEPILLSEPENLNSWNYYAIFGGGFLYYYADVVYADNSNGNVSYNKGTNNFIYGAQARKHINSSWDFLAGIDYNYNQSYYIDGAGAKNELNTHFYVNAGISYKFSTSKNRELVDWSYVNYVYPRNKTNEISIDRIPVISLPKVVDSIKAVEPIKVAEPIIVAEPIKEVEPIKEIETVKKIEPKVSPVTNDTVIVEPEFIYNIVVGCYSINKLNIAKSFKNKINKKGFNAKIYLSKDSEYYRLITLTTEDEKLALKMLRKSRREIDQGSWLYLYNKQ